MFTQLKRLIENKKEGHMHETPIKRKTVHFCLLLYNVKTAVFRVSDWHV